MDIIKEPITNYYQIGAEIGKGRFAKVRELIRLDDGQKFAGKFQVKRRAAKHINQEVQVYKLCSSHPRFPAVHGVYESGNEIVIVLDYAFGGEIYPYCVGTDPENPDDEDSEGLVFTEDDVIKYMTQLLQAVQFLHKNNILHLDLKPQNILLSAPCPEGDIILVDFGLSRALDASSDQRVFAGTPDYLAPELVNYDPISSATDVWSLGVVCYVMLTGQSPFAGETAQETSNNICNVDYEFPQDLFSGISQHAQTFISSIFKRNPKHRATIEECLKHPWISGHSSSTAEKADKNTDVLQVEVSTSPDREHVFWANEDDPDHDPNDASRSASCSPSTCSESSSENTSPLQMARSPASVINRSGVYHRLCLSEEHSNSSDSAAVFSDDDVTTLKRTADLASTSLPLSSSPCPPQKFKSYSTSSARKAASKESPGKLSDFRRLSLKRKPKSETTPCKVMNIR